MKRLEISVGQKYSMLTVIEELPISQNGRTFKCMCDCGNAHTVLMQHLVRLKIKSCGCHRRKTSTRHGMWESREYSSWENMIQRCLNPKARKYYLYGGRGITVCEEWLKSFAAFYADMGPRPEGTSLDRKDSEKGYYKDNCKWSTFKEQSVNVRSFSQFVKYNGVVQPTEKWLEELNLDRTVFKSRLLRGMSFKESLFSETDVICLNITNGEQTISHLKRLLVDKKLERNKTIELLDNDHEVPYFGYIVRYLTGFKGWPESVVKRYFADTQGSVI